MANVNTPRGLRPVRKLGGGFITLTEYSIATATGAIYSGDKVKLTGTGNGIAQAAETDELNIGVFAGCRYVQADGSIKFSAYWPGSVSATGAVALVYDDPTIVFEVQGDTVNEADIGLLADIAPGSGSTTTGMSAGYAKVATGATSGKNFQIIRLAQRPDNAYGAYAKIEGIFVEHAYKTGTPTAGVIGV